MYRFLIFLFLTSMPGWAQLRLSDKLINLGRIDEAYEIKGDLTVENTSDKKIFLMRADADAGVKVYTSKKTLMPGDTCLLVISFLPETAGAFDKKIRLVSSDQAKPYLISLQGHLKTVKTNDRMACVYFGKQKPVRSVTKPDLVVAAQQPVERDRSNRIPDVPNNTPAPVPEVKKAEPVAVYNKPKETFDDHKPNNILFLVDVSSSMRDSLKLPVMKTALHRLIDEVRDIDSISFLTYASKVVVLEEAVSGNEKERLHRLVDTLKAKGMTAGSKAILVSMDVAQKHYIPTGNNQIILATDGQFHMTPENKSFWMEKQKRKKIILSTVAFGEDKKALKNLKDLAQRGDGSFIHFNDKQKSRELLLQEIEQRSRR